MKKILPFWAFWLLPVLLPAQQAYRYSLDLGKLQNDRLQVTLAVPALNQRALTFTFPRIIPGTYKIADYGAFVSEVKAFDKAGKTLPVQKLNTNQWRISNAGALATVTYTLDDIYDAEQTHDIYPMAATSFEEKAAVLHTPGLFGFFDGYHKLPFEITVNKPAELYGATALKPVRSTPTQDVFRTADLNDLYESPILYAVPDTATVKVANTEVLVAVHSPNKQVQARQVADWMADLLQAAKSYLGGKLPTDKYAFLFYFKEPSLKHSFPAGLWGALEHPTSSFYYVHEAPAQQLKGSIVNIASHEFFHIVTPLTIASKEVKEFNYNDAVLSKHLWLYEGSTEYTAHHVQVKYGLTSVPQFLKTLSDKITLSRSHYNDALPFTEMSEHAAGKHEPQYGNVYQKGALINACLDLLLLNRSDGRYGLRNLTYDLGVRYGKDRAFDDETLFEEIGKLSYPEAEAFLEKYVAGATPIPYEEYFALAGLKFTPLLERQVVSLGGFSPGLKPNGVFFINPNTRFNAFGEKVGYKAGDEIYAFNGVRVTQQNFGKVADSLRKTLKPGDKFTATVGRSNGGSMDTLQLSTTVVTITETERNKLEPMPHPTAQMQRVQKAWLTAPAEEVAGVPADPVDVASIDAIVKAIYDVISGGPGKRNWQRFHSLFLPGAKMGAVVPAPTGEASFKTMTPTEYQRGNGAFFEQNGFYERELGRNVAQYGNVASVESAYGFRLQPDGPVAQRGVNYFTLVKSDGRWWIANLSWQSETPELPVPASLLKN